MVHSGMFKRKTLNISLLEKNDLVNISISEDYKDGKYHTAVDIEG